MLDGKYAVERVLGSGAFGKVLLARDTIANRNVAIKSFVNANFTEDDITREIRLLASLLHPNVVVFHHHFLKNSRLHLVMEYCPNGTLANRLSHAKLQIDEALDLTIKICNGLSYIHEQLIVHRDLKPSNILFSENFEPKISDFGVSNTLGGTPLYLPPEANDPNFYPQLEFNYDTYSLGLALLEMIFGHLPFIYNSKKEILSQKFSQSFIPNNLPNWLREIIIKATHPLPEFRFQSASDFSHSLQTKSVPFIINKKNISAESLFANSLKSISRKKWRDAEKYFLQGFLQSDDSAFGNFVAGTYHLKTNNIPSAKQYFDRALKLNPGVNAKKELAEINIDEGNFQEAASMLQNHIQLNPIDWEAYNLLLECYFRMDERLDLAIDIFESIKHIKTPNCFRNNFFLINLFRTDSDRSIFDRYRSHSGNNPFIEYNISLLDDESNSWFTADDMKKKFLFQSFRFNSSKKNNKIIIESGNHRFVSEKAIISIGRNKENDFTNSNKSISRRHCAIINSFNDIWIYDLGSSLGVYVDGLLVSNKAFLPSGKHTILLGSFEFFLFTSDDILL